MVNGTRGASFGTFATLPTFNPQGTGALQALQTLTALAQADALLRTSPTANLFAPSSGSDWLSSMLPAPSTLGFGAVGGPRDAMSFFSSAAGSGNFHTVTANNTSYWVDPTMRQPLGSPSWETQLSQMCMGSALNWPIGFGPGVAAQNFLASTSTTMGGTTSYGQLFGGWGGAFSGFSAGSSALQGLRDALTQWLPAFAGRSGMVSPGVTQVGGGSVVRPAPPTFAVDSNGTMAQARDLSSVWNTQGTTSLSQGVSIGLDGNGTSNVGGSDVDMVKFEVARGQTASFSLVNATAEQKEGGGLPRNAADLANGQLRLFNANGEVVASGTGTLDFTFPDDGIYYLGVSAQGNSAYDPSTTTGRAIGTGGAAILNIDATPPPPAVDAKGFQLPAPGTVVTQQAEAWYNPTTGEEHVTPTGGYTPPNADWVPSNAVPRVPDSNGTMAQAHDANVLWNQNGTTRVRQPVSIGLDSNATGRVGGADVDMLKFDAARGQSATFSLNNLTAEQKAEAGMSPDTIDLANGELRLFNTSGEVVASGTGSLNYTFTDDGTYYLGVSAQGNAAYDPSTTAGRAPGTGGATMLSIDATSAPSLALDSNGTMEQAIDANRLWNRFGTTEVRQTVAIGLDQDIGELSNVGSSDVDMIRFDAAQGQTARFSLENLTADQRESAGLPPDSADLVNGELRLFNAQGDVVASGTGTLEYTFPDNATYYLGVSGHGNTDYDPDTTLGRTPGTRGVALLSVDSSGAVPLESSPLRGIYDKLNSQGTNGNTSDNIINIDDIQGYLESVIGELGSAGPELIAQESGDLLKLVDHFGDGFPATMSDGASHALEAIRRATENGTVGILGGSLLADLAAIESNEQLIEQLESIAPTVHSSGQSAVIADGLFETPAGPVPNPAAPPADFMSAARDWVWAINDGIATGQRQPMSGDDVKSLLTLWPHPRDGGRIHNDAFRIVRSLSGAEVDQDTRAALDAQARDFRSTDTTTRWVSYGRRTVQEFWHTVDMPNALAQELFRMQYNLPVVTQTREPTAYEVVFNNGVPLDGASIRPQEGRLGGLDWESIFRSTRPELGGGWRPAKRR